MKNINKPKWYKNTCPHCHQETSSRPRDWTYDDGTEFTSQPHESPYECIEYLRSIITDLVYDVGYLKDKDYD